MCWILNFKFSFYILYFLSSCSSFSLVMLAYPSLLTSVGVDIAFSYSSRLVTLSYKFLFLPRNSPILMSLSFNLFCKSSTLTVSTSFACKSSITFCSSCIFVWYSSSYYSSKCIFSYLTRRDPVESFCCSMCSEPLLPVPP